MIAKNIAFKKALQKHRTIRAQIARKQQLRGRHVSADLMVAVLRDVTNTESAGFPGLSKIFLAGCSGNGTQKTGYIRFLPAARCAPLGDEEHSQVTGKENEMRGQHPFRKEIVEEILENYPTELSNAEVKKLFDITSDSSCMLIKRQIRKVMREQNLRVWNGYNVNTKATFIYAGLEYPEDGHGKPES